MSSAKRTTGQTLAEHFHELQIRLTWVFLAVAAGGIAAYTINGKLLRLLQDPLGETLYYTSPTGGFAFTFKLCIVAGVIFALPVLLYNLFRYLEPVVEHHKIGMLKYTFWSFALAYGGVAFAYFVSLPAALHFLTQFGGNSVQSLINVNEYFNFAMAYVCGFACLFQLPLIVLFINKIKPLKPSKMMSFQRYIIVGSFILAAILTPTPDPFNQAMMAGPIIILYQLSIGLVLVANRTTRKARRQAKQAAARPVFAPIAKPLVPQMTQPAVAPVLVPKSPAKVKPRKPAYVNDIKPIVQKISRPPQRRTNYIENMVRRPIVTMPIQRALVGNDFTS